MSDFKILDAEKRKQLEVEKVESRLHLLSMPPEEAQEKIASILHSSSWFVADENLTWDDPLPLADDPIDS